MDSKKGPYKPWRDEELDRLRRYVDAKVSIKKAALDFDRTESSITNAAHRLRKADLEAKREIHERQRMEEQMHSALRLYDEFNCTVLSVHDKLLGFADKILRVVIRR